MTEVAALLKKPEGVWPRLLRVSTPVFGAGQTSAVTVELLAQGEENAASFSLRFDARQWRFVSAAAGEDAPDALLSINTKQAADGRVGFALALPPGRAFEAGLRSLVVVTFAAAEGGGTLAPEVAFSDLPAARELADVKAATLAADWMPAAREEAGGDAGGAETPRLFTANEDGQGVAAGVVIRVGADGVQRFEPLAVYDPVQNRFVAAPIELSDENEQVYLALFGTGWRNGSAAEEMQVTVDGVPVEVVYAGAQGRQVGLDQLNLRLPYALKGRGEHTFQVVSGGHAANSVKIVVQ